MIVLDASAVLTLVQGEPGEQRVRQALDEEPVLSAATLAEAPVLSLGDRLCLALTWRLDVVVELLR